MAEPRPKRKIIIIPAKKESSQEQAKKRNLRVAAYCRVSTGDEEQLTSYENQKAFYTEKIMKNPDWTMVDIFADEGITGTSTCRRKQFLRMIRQCRQGKIDMIPAKSVSRFARNTLDTISYTRELRSLGIAVIFEEQNINSIYPESEFLITLHGAFAQAESESTSSRVRWGKRQAMKSGHVAMQYKQLLGYEKGPDGKPRIVPEQAETVRFIYDRYLAGDSIREIKDNLQRLEDRLTVETQPEEPTPLQDDLYDEVCRPVLRAADPAVEGRSRRSRSRSRDPFSWVRSEQEMEENPRSKSAKLRIFERKL